VPTAQRSAQAGTSDYPWQVHIEDAAGKIRGAGIMLDGEYVLTCAHVALPGPADLARQSPPGIRIRIDSRDDLEARPATVVPGQIAPIDPVTGRGDVVLLRLTRPVQNQPPTQLRRAWRVRQRVRVFGYPTGIAHGMWADAEVVGRAVRQSQLVQLNVTPAGPQVEKGFSGTAVIDEGTEDIIGMIRERAIDAGGACWMIPVSAIIENLPFVSRYVFAPSTDPGFGGAGERPAWDRARRALLTELAGWLGSDGPGGLCVVSGGRGSAREVLLGTLAAGPAHEPDAPARHRPVDVAVHAAGKTTGQVSRQLVTGLGGGRGGGDNAEADVARLVTDLGPSVSIVIDSVDAADQPAALVEELLGLVIRCPRPAVRLLLGFGDGVPERLRDAVVAELTGPPRQLGPGSAGDAHGAADARMAKAIALVEELAAVEDEACEKHSHVAYRIANVPPPAVGAAAALRIRLSVLRAAGGAADGGWRAAETDACERTVAQCLANLRTLMAGLDALLAGRNALRNELDVYRELAAEGGFEEDQRLDLYYLRASDLLWHPSCDMDRAAQAVRAYYQAILRRQGERS
jgi:Trypsin-like peptidase domain